MTVAELIEILKTLPQDIPVYAYNGGGGWSSLEACDVEYSDYDNVVRLTP